ncbi:hypothetical protein FOA43_003945 [Brettanomyces nanus]|uniref:Protein kinase domain-containing protein n=1 Tax=Eeniella nana TaxID=13502 RepID=A0A875S8N3_EENNA|nr:uncharacterized protein FOA43_003945 [Brettanomyces nanus]QPG76555.1 hypothetical protein FOA43_003945 [Brettanomyces nanus]
MASNAYNHHSKKLATSGDDNEPSAKHGPIHFFRSIKNHISRDIHDSIGHKGSEQSRKHSSTTYQNLSSEKSISFEARKNSASTLRVRSYSLTSKKAIPFLDEQGEGERSGTKVPVPEQLHSIPLKNDGAHDNDSTRSSVHKSLSSPQLIKPDDSSSLKRAHTTAAHPHKMEYNPYGIFRASHIVDFGTMFGSGEAKPESMLMLPYPTEDPNDYLPPQFQEKCQSLEDLYDTTANSSIGSGGAALIKRVRLKSNQRVYVALKKFSLFRGESAQQYYRRIVQEYVVMKNFKHIHTVSCYELLKLPVYMQRSWGMTMAFFPCDLLSQVRKTAWRATSLSERLCFFKQICFGLKYMHECDIAHLDIKPENILVASNGILRITDLGCCEFGHEEPGNFKSPVKLRNKLLGTPPYQPPEVALYKRLEIGDRPKFDPFKFDYWSLGVLLFVLIRGKTPFAECKPSDLNFLDYEKTYTRFCDIVPEFLKNDVSKCPTKGRFAEGFANPKIARIGWRLCDPNYKTRMTIPELFEDEFFQKIEMCIDEANYECNFVHHRGAKGRAFEVEYGSDVELVKNGKLGCRRLTNTSSMRNPSISDRKTPDRLLGDRPLDTGLPSDKDNASPTASHKYESLVEMGLRSRRHEDSHGISSSSSSNSSASSINNAKRSTSVHYQSDLNRVDESKREEEEDRRNESPIKSSSSSLEPVVDSHASSSNLTSTSTSSFNTTESDWNKYEDAITEDESSSFLSATPSVHNNNSDMSDRSPTPGPEVAPSTSVEIHESEADSENKGTNEINPYDKYEFIHPDGTASFYEFSDDDHKDKNTEYMVVNYDTMVKNTQFEVVTHAHAIY